ncbi:MAG: RpiB/LacA/LacB family sugar-phosphate isomerase [Parcubacteria group bacterium]|nr:RpiB/LacA/LacB family sugar-phosphate isomerase [Parcubacteria group bacterium]
MMIYIGADHRGYDLKETLKTYLKELNFNFEDLGALELVPDDDYPDYAVLVAKKVAEDPENNRGILICGSGVGVDIVANKIKKVRSALLFNVEQARMSRNDDNANVLSFSSDFTDENSAKEILKIWLETPFSRLERHARRVEKIKGIE